MAKGTAMNASSASDQVTYCSWKTRQSRYPITGALIPATPF